MILTFKGKGISFMLFCCCWVAPVIWGQEERRFNVYGFVSQGYLDSSEHNYLADTEEGTFEFTEAAVNAMASFGDSIRVGVQLFARDLGDQGNHEVIIDWAYGEYIWKDAISFRIGRIKHPLGFYNQGRDADLLRPQVMLPQSVYPEGMRDLILAYQGVNIYGNLPGDIEYEIYAGATSLDEDNPTVQSLFFQLVNSDVLESSDLKNKKQLGAALKWNTPVEGLAVGVSRLEADLEGTVNLTPAFGIDFEVPDIEFLFYSAEYQYDRLILAAELFELELKPEGIPIDDESFRTEGWYVSAAWRFNDHVEIHYNYDVFYADADDKGGVNFAPRPSWFAWQKDHTLGIRLDITSQFIIKAEWHEINGMGLLWAYDAPNIEEPFTEDWSLGAVKATFHF